MGRAASECSKVSDAGVVASIVLDERHPALDELDLGEDLDAGVVPTSRLVLRRVEGPARLSRRVRSRPPGVDEQLFSSECSAVRVVQRQ